VAKTFGTSALFGRRSGVLDPSGPVLPDGAGPDGDAVAAFRLRHHAAAL